MAKKFKKTKLATAISIAAVSLGLSATADAVVVVGGDNGWEVSFDGNINAFYTLTDYDAGFTTLGYVTPGQRPSPNWTAHALRPATSRRSLVST
jgi:hypothetical protein